MVTHAAGTNAPVVADHALALLLAIVRAIPDYSASVKAGDWCGTIQSRPMLTNKKLGILGLGDIGARIAKRAEAFDLHISYVATRPKPQYTWTYVPTVMELPEKVDFLISAAPGGVATFHMINRGVLRALGPDGFLVNVGRGSVVDTEALIEALSNKTIAGAALDVFEEEPVICPELRNLSNIVFTPHIGGIAHEVQQRSADLMLGNIEAFFAGSKILSPVPDIL